MAVQMQGQNAKYSHLAQHLFNIEHLGNGHIDQTPVGRKNPLDANHLQPFGDHDKNQSHDSYYVV